MLLIFTRCCLRVAVHSSRCCSSSPRSPSPIALMWCGTWRRRSRRPDDQGSRCRVTHGAYSALNLSWKTRDLRDTEVDYLPKFLAKGFMSCFHRYNTFKPVFGWWFRLHIFLFTERNRMKNKGYQIGLADWLWLCGEVRLLTNPTQSL